MGLAVSSRRSVSESESESGPAAAATVLQDHGQDHGQGQGQGQGESISTASHENPRTGRLRHHPDPKCSRAEITVLGILRYILLRIRANGIGQDLLRRYRISEKLVIGLGAELKASGGRPTLLIYYCHHYGLYLGADCALVLNADDSKRTTSDYRLQQQEQEQQQQQHADNDNGQRDQQQQQQQKQDLSQQVVLVTRR
ncbi:GL14357 [Drosophila persimilis]|uniref:GL14357 n=1 Tax=Drosophila persimilis TaxID=7234 RepID=B4GTI1_DROPE|nr:GL14357 [Drosophila persimilis]